MLTRIQKMKTSKASKMRYKPSIARFKAVHYRKQTNTHSQVKTA